MKKEVGLPEKEELVLSVLWEIEENGRNVICNDVIKKLKDEYGLDYAKTTVYTFLNNLVKKGYVKNEKKGVNCYVTIKSKDEYLETVLRRINKIFFNGDKKKLINTIKTIDL